jgi:hypothetical protein
MTVSMRALTRALVLFLLAGCGGDDDGPLDLGKVCSRIASPACDRAIACNLGPNSNKQECVTAFVEGCCQDSGKCGQMARDKEAEAALEQYITRCSAAFPAFDCAEYAKGQAPAACSAPISAAVAEPMSVLPPTVLSPTDLPKVRALGRAVGRRLLEP